MAQKMRVADGFLVIEGRPLADFSLPSCAATAS